MGGNPARTGPEPRSIIRLGLMETIFRSVPCPECGDQMVWTQDAWPPDAMSRAAYRCVNGHVVDPATTRQCPTCGVHDTERVGGAEAATTQFRCFRCGTRFTSPR
jgi:predicted RNA-binding Zn-ribbon protein involved in translation (DUF1610 family)